MSTCDSGSKSCTALRPCAECQKLLTDHVLAAAVRAADQEIKARVVRFVQEGGEIVWSEAQAAHAKAFFDAYQIAHSELSDRVKAANELRSELNTKSKRQKKETRNGQEHEGQRAGEDGAGAGPGHQ